MFSLSARCRWRAAAAGVAVATALALPAAALGQAVTVTLNPASVQPGGTSTVTAGIPVSNAGTVSQEIVQTIDPTKAVLTGLSDISKPVGWGLSFFDGSAWSNTTPANVASWAQVTKVKTSGTINSQGSESGYQIAVGTANGAVANLTPPSIPSSGGGDGFVAFFDAGRTRVFNVYHHKLGGGQLDCHVLATGSTCAGFPFAVGIQRTGQYSSGRVVGTRVWIPAYKKGATTADDSVGFYCVDISAVLASGSPDSGVYIGQCDPCNAVVRHVVMRDNAIGYFATNTRGRVVVTRSEMSGNRLGVALNSDDAELGAPQQGTILRGNVISGNRITGNGDVGVLILNQQGYRPTANRFTGNTITGQQVDVVVTGRSAGCFSGNRIGTSNPAGIEQVAPCTGAPTSTAARTPWSPAPAAPEIDYRKIPLPPPQPGMPTP